MPPHRTTPSAQSDSTAARNPFPPDSPEAVAFEKKHDVLEELRNISRMLHTLWHRQRNQHRVAGWWWKWFGVLKRQLGKLVTELEGMLEVERQKADLEMLGGKKGKKSLKRKLGNREDGEAKKGGEDEAVRKRADFLRGEVGERAFCSFKALIGDIQFAPLGLMLLTTLARLLKVIAPLGSPIAKTNQARIENRVEEVVQNQTQELSEDLGEVLTRDDVAAVELEAARSMAITADTKRKKQAETHTREEIHQDPVGMVNTGENSLETAEPPKVAGKRKRKADRSPVTDVDEGALTKETSVKPAKKKKKKKKKGDVFDDLFSGLV